MDDLLKQLEEYFRGDERAKPVNGTVTFTDEMVAEARAAKFTRKDLKQPAVKPRVEE